MPRLYPLQRAYWLGFRGARLKAKAELHALAKEWETELAILQDDPAESTASICILSRQSSSARRCLQAHCSTSGAGCSRRSPSRFQGFGG